MTNFATRTIWIGSIWTSYIRSTLRRLTSSTWIYLSTPTASTPLGGQPLGWLGEYTIGHNAKSWATAPSSFIPDGQNPVDVLADEPLETVKQKMAHGDGEAEYSMLPIRNPVDSSYSGYCVTFRGIYQAEGRSRDSATAGDAGVAIPSYSGDTQLEEAQRDLMQFVAVPIVDGK